MRWSDDIVKKTADLSIILLQQTLLDIKENGQNVSARFRLIGELWQEKFVRIVAVTEDRVLVVDEHDNKMVSLKLKDIMQFEVDRRFKVLEPFFHYNIVL